MLQFFLFYYPLGQLLIRIAIGSCLIGKSWRKIRNFNSVEKSLKQLGFSFKFWPYLWIASELLGGILIFVGGLTSFAVFLISGLLILKILIKKFKTHQPYGQDLFVILILLSLLFLGPGLISIDEIFNLKF